MFVDVESPIAAFLVEALGECEGHPASAASDLEHEVLLLEAHVLDERAAAHANTAGTSALAAGGANLAEAQVLASLGRRDEIGDVVVTFAEDNIVLRDIDGPPLLVNDRELEVDEFIDRVDRRTDATRAQ